MYRIVQIVGLGMTQWVMWCLLCLLSYPLAHSQAASFSGEPVSIYKDAKSIMIVGDGVGQEREASQLSVVVNGIDFTIAVYPGSGIEQSPYRSCQRLQELIVSYYLGSSVTREFDAFCFPIVGNAALLLLQASLVKYPPPDASDNEMAKRLNLERRILYVESKSTDDKQRLYRR
jgi:hypothetical protein